MTRTASLVAIADDHGTTYSLRNLCGASAILHAEFNEPIGLTSCCAASVTYVGNPGGDDVCVCKACHAPADPLLGTAGYASVHAATVAAGCPVPDECTQFMLSVLSDAREQAATH